MFTFPPSKWVGGILYEHGHRLIASTVGFLTIILAAWLWRADSRRWMKRLGVAALLAVITQGVLGGVTVLFFLPDADLDGARGPGGNLLLHDGGDRALHVARLDRIDRRGRRPDAARGRDRHDCAHLHADHRRRGDAPQRRWTGNSRLPADVRRHRSGSLDERHRDPLRAPGRRAPGRGRRVRHVGAHLVSPPRTTGAGPAGAAHRRPGAPCRSRSARSRCSAAATSASTAPTSSAARWCWRPRS